MTVTRRPPHGQDEPVQARRVPYPSRRSLGGRHEAKPLVPSQPWAARAACRAGYPEELWWPDGSDGGTPTSPDARVLVAREVCRGCPVRAECLDAAQARPEPLSTANGGGIWGGVTGPERRRLPRSWRLGGPLPEIPRMGPAELAVALAGRWAGWLPATVPTSVTHRSLATQAEHWLAQQRAS